MSQPQEVATSVSDTPRAVAVPPPPVRSSKSPIALDPAMNGAQAGRAIHLSLLETVLANEAGTRQGLDPECLHQLRVAVRRARSALAQLRDVFEADAVAHLKVELRWLQTTTGPVRDLDVYLLKMEDYRGDLPESIRGHLDPLETYLHEHHALERQHLVSALDSERYARVLTDWRALVENTEPALPDRPNAARPIGELAAERIRHAYRQVRKEGDAITPSSPPEALHALRIKCKRLRYLLEFFGPLFGEKKTGRLVAPLKVLQDNLGDFNDLTLQQARLTDFAHDMVREQQVGADSLLAMGRLVEHLAARQAGERGRFEKSYAAFSRPRIRRRLRRLLRRKALKRE